MLKNLLLALCISILATVSMANASKIEDSEDFPGNWHAIFFLKDGVTQVEHTPKYIRLGRWKAEQITLYNKFYNEMPLLEPLVLKINFTIKEFYDALKASGLLGNR